MRFSKEWEDIYKTGRQEGSFDFIVDRGSVTCNPTVCIKNMCASWNFAAKK